MANFIIVTMKLSLVLCLLIGVVSAFPGDLTCRGVSRRNKFELKDCSFDPRNSTISCKSYLYLSGTQQNKLAIEMTSTFFPLTNERYSMFFNRTAYDTCLGLKSMSLRKVASIPSRASNVFNAPPLVVALQERFDNFSATIDVNSSASVGFLANLEECRTQKRGGPCSPQIAVTSFIVTPGALEDFDTLDLIHSNIKKFYMEKMNARLNTLTLHLTWGTELNVWLPYFKGTKLKHLNLDDNPVYGFDNNEFESFDQLETLSMRRCFLERIAPDNFQKGTTNLKTLDLSQNKLTEVPSGVKYLNKLEDLNLSYQNTAARKFEMRGVLRNLTNLKVLNMSHTSLFEISRSSFPSNLEILDLSFCNLKSIPENLFSYMRSLRIIFINGNRLKSIPQNTFRGMNVTVHHDYPEEMPPDVIVHPEPEVYSSSSVVRISLVTFVLVLMNYVI